MYTILKLLLIILLIFIALFEYCALVLAKQSDYDMENDKSKENK